MNLNLQETYFVKKHWCNLGFKVAHLRKFENSASIEAKSNKVVKHVQWLSQKKGMRHTLKCGHFGLRTLVGQSIKVAFKSVSLWILCDDCSPVLCV